MINLLTKGVIYAQKSEDGVLGIIHSLRSARGAPAKPAVGPAVCFLG